MAVTPATPLMAGAQPPPARDPTHAPALRLKPPVVRHETPSTPDAPPAAGAISLAPAVADLTFPMAPQSVQDTAQNAAQHPERNDRSSAPGRPPKTMASGIGYLRAPSAEYPANARRYGEQGKVLLRVQVDEFGRPERADIETSSGFPALDGAAKAAAMRALFVPFVEAGKAVPVQVLVPIEFRIEE